MIIDTRSGHILYSAEIDNDLESRHSYREWMEKNVRRLVPFEDLPDEEVGSRELDDNMLVSHQKQFNYGTEELDSVIHVLGENGQEAVGSIGDDTPFTVLSSQPRIIYDCLCQQFIQVTNPLVDPLREVYATSLAISIGCEMSVFCEAGGQTHRLSFKSPILLYPGSGQLTTMEEDHYRTDTLDITSDVTKTTLEATVKELCNRAEKMVRSDTVLLVFPDRDIARGRLPVLAPTTTGAIQTRPAEQSLCYDADIIVETASARDPYHFAVLLGFDATAIYPYLAYEILGRLVDTHTIAKDYRTVMFNYRNGINKGLYEIMSKTGISAIASYRCSKLSKAVGLHDGIVGLCFQGTVSHTGGASFEDFQQDLLNLSKRAWLVRKPIGQGGLLKYVHGDKYHVYSPDMVRTLQQAVQSGECSDYQEYVKLVNERPATILRNLLVITSGENAVNTADVEPASELFKRFNAVAISIGALGPETHGALAEATNSIGDNSNSGEDGEDPAHYDTDKVLRIEQVTSGCFGVTSAYPVNADVIQIKVAQGVKPGEGGQLPGNKVTPYIAKLRYSMSSMTLISLPPHHDIYSTEDLAQLISDLKQVNPKAMISVELVSEPGVGIIATGVTKAYTDLITIAGYDSGTGASPLPSVKYAGCSWGLSLVETQQTLVANGLRHKTCLQADGGLKTGVDIIKATILSAESFGFGTGPMVAFGCKYLRICHLNSYVTGVATQDDRPCKDHYHGLPFRATDYSEFITRETYELMAQLGVTCLVDLIGYIDLPRGLDGFTTKQQELALSKPLETVEPHPSKALHCTKNNPPFDNGLLNAQLLQQAKPFISGRQSKIFWSDIRSTGRFVGTPLSGYVAQMYGDQGLTADPIRMYFNDIAGQGSGMWNAGGVEPYLTDDANDYVGKGMVGGLVATRPLVGSVFRSHEASIIGNACLYGATGGRLYAASRVGERFGVRSSGAIIVVEGIGDNGYEYMTSGIVCILGKTGVSFGTGMTGGFACVLDESGDSCKRVSPELVEILSADDLVIHEGYLRGPITEYVQHTGSQCDEKILANWPAFAMKFVLIKPKSSDAEILLGHHSRSAAELRVQVQ